MKKIMILLFVILMLVGSIYATPDTGNIQAVIQGFGDATADVTITFINESDDQEIYSETKTIDITNGILDYVFGLIEPISSGIFFKTPVSQKITIDGDSSPKIPLTSVPYAWVADIAENVYYSDILNKPANIDEDSKLLLYRH